MTLQTMEKASIRVTIKSFHQPTIETAITKLVQLVKLQESIHKISFCKKQERQHKWSCIPLPPSIKRFTVLRSPHIDKKSREQFLQKNVAATMYFAPTAARIAPLLLAMLKNSQLVGVQLRVRVVLATGLYQ
jgi:ribosomal protein S10